MSRPKPQDNLQLEDRTASLTHTSLAGVRAMKVDATFVCAKCFPDVRLHDAPPSPSLHFSLGAGHAYILAGALAWKVLARSGVIHTTEPSG